MVGYLDDFSTIAPAALGRTAALSFSRFARPLGFELNDKKSDLGDEAVFLGLSGSFPSSTDGSRLRISRPGERLKWSHLSPTYLEEGRIPHRCLD